MVFWPVTGSDSSFSFDIMEWKISSIVVGIDGSAGSRRAAAHAAAMARHWDANLKMVTVVRPPEGWWGLDGAPPSPEALSAAMVKGQQQILRDVENDLALEGVSYQTVEELGEPASRLMAVCEDCDADILVIGRRGAGLAERMLLGSTADRLTHMSACPVLVVP